MASAAIGGSHLVASTQAGALYGWQLALIIVLTNLFKYPFFRFSAHYTLDSGKSLIRIIFAVLLLLNFAFSLDLLRLNEYKEQNVSGWLASEKLDGVRAYWDGENLLSRQGKKTECTAKFY